jgi:hypothetical protein
MNIIETALYIVCVIWIVGLGIFTLGCAIAAIVYALFFK